MGKRILIFSEDKSVSNILKDIFESEEREVFVSDNSNNVIEMANHFKPSIIMMDKNGSVHGCVLATQSIKLDKNLKHIPIIFFTESDDISKLPQLTGADVYIAKPFDLCNLFDTIQKILQLPAESILI